MNLSVISKLKSFFRHLTILISGEELVAFSSALTLVAEQVLRDSKVAGSNPPKSKFYIYIFANFSPKKLIINRFVCP